jgi:hypothetical protein
VPIQLYVGATGKVVPEWEKALVGGRAPKKRPLVGGRAFPTLHTVFQTFYEHLYTRYVLQRLGLTAMAHKIIFAALGAGVSLLTQ